MMSTMSVAVASRVATVSQVRNSNWVYREVLETYVAPGMRWLDLGCGHQLLPSWMDDGDEASRRLVGRTRMVVGADQVVSALQAHTTISHRVAADSVGLPFRDKGFDLVTANMVVEHVDDPRGLLSEVRRVLAPGGLFLFHTPNRHFYQVALSLLVPASLRRRAASAIEHRPDEDVFPTRYRMNTRRALLALAQASDFRVVEFRFVNSSLAFERFGPIAVVERAIRRCLESPRLERARSNLVVAFRRDR